MVQGQTYQQDATTYVLNRREAGNVIADILLYAKREKRVGIHGNGTGVIISYEDGKPSHFRSSVLAELVIGDDLTLRVYDTSLLSDRLRAIAQRYSFR